MNDVALAQGVYFLLSGAWAVVDIASFQRVTGPKTDLWLVRTVALLLASIGAGLIVGGARSELGGGLIVLAVTSAASLIAIELVYVSRRVIAPIYLADAAIEAGFLAAWAWTGLR
jgi:hypothetical protein